MPTIVVQSMEIRSSVERYTSSPPIPFFVYFLFFTHFVFSLFKIFYFRNETNDGIRGRAVARKASKLSDESPPIESVEKEKATS